MGTHSHTALHESPRPAYSFLPLGFCTCCSHCLGCCSLISNFCLTNFGFPGSVSETTCSPSVESLAHISAKTALPEIAASSQKASRKASVRGVPRGHQLLIRLRSGSTVLSLPSPGSRAQGRGYLCAWGPAVDTAGGGSAPASAWTLVAEDLSQP